MDTFMDKLADKINAQEMIRANTAAEVEELGRVKGQIESLKNCVDQAESMLGQLQANLERAEGVASQAQAASERAENAADQMKATSEQMENIAVRMVELQSAKEETKQTETEGEQETATEKAAALDADILYIIEDEVSQLGKALENIGKGEGGKVDFEELKGLTGNLQGELTQIGTTISNLQEKMTEIQNEVREGNAKADDGETIESIVAGMDEIKKHYLFVENLSEKFFSLEERVEQIKLVLSQPLKVEEKETADYSEDIFALKTELSSMKETLSDMQGIVRDTQGAVQETQGVMSETREQIGRLGEKGKEQGEGFADLKVELSRLDEHLTNVGASANSKTTESTEALKRFLTEQIDKLSKAKEQDQNEDAGKDVEELKTLLEEIKNLQEERKKQLEERLTGMHEGLREGYHKECVKVYRNVQAAFGEENQRQTVTLEEKMEKSSGNAKLAMIFSILAFGMGLASVVLQVLSILKIL